LGYIVVQYHDESTCKREDVWIEEESVKIQEDDGFARKEEAYSEVGWIPPLLWAIQVGES